MPGRGIRHSGCGETEATAMVETAANAIVREACPSSTVQKLGVRQTVDGTVENSERREATSAELMQGK